MTTKTPLCNFSFRGAAEDTSHVLQLINNSGSRFHIFFNSILIIKEVTSLNSVIHMFFPSIWLRISKRSRNSALGCSRMRTGGINLGQYGDIEFFTNLKSAAHSCKTSTDDHYIMLNHKNTSKRGKHFNSLP